MLEQIESIFAIVGVIITAATAIVAGLEMIAGITPTTKDDEFVGKVKKGLALLSTVMDKVSVWNVKK